MSQPQGYFSNGPYVGTPPAPARRNTVGLIAVIAGAVGFVFACIPGALIVGWMLLPIAFVLGIVGVCLSGQTKATSIAAIIISIVGAVVGAVVFLTVVSDAFSDTFDRSDAPTASSPDTAGQAGTPGDDVGGRSNPFPIGEQVTSRDWQVTLGAPYEAWREVAAENQFNEPPEPGMEYWMVPVSTTYIGDDTGNLMVGVRVGFVGADNRTYDDGCGVIPDDLSDIGDLYQDGSAQGNVCVAVPAGADGLWTVSSGFGDPAFFEAN